MWKLHNYVSCSGFLFPYFFVFFIFVLNWKWLIISHQKTFIQKLISKIYFPINVVWKKASWMGAYGIKWRQRGKGGNNVLKSDVPILLFIHSLKEQLRESHELWRLSPHEKQIGGFRSIIKQLFSTLTSCI